MPSVAGFARGVAANIWPIVLARSQQGWRWLMAPRDPITWAALRAKLATLPLPSTNAGRLTVLVGIVLLLLLVLPWYAKGHKDEKGVVTYPNAALINPILAGLGAILLIYAAIRQAQTASNRHEAQTKADLQRRITESFSKAIEQLGSDKLEVRLGGIYALERISQESAPDYWTVMENLTAFVRERTQRTEAERTANPLAERSEEFWLDASEKEKPGAPSVNAVLTGMGAPPSTDVAAVLTVIQRRSDRAREARDRNILDFRQAILRSANFREAHLERAFFREAHVQGATFLDAHLEEAIFLGAHLERAILFGAHLERAILIQAHLKRAYLPEVHLEGANLSGAHLEGANLIRAHLERADLSGTHLEGAELIKADLTHAHLEGADLSEAYLHGADLHLSIGLTQAQIDLANGDAETQLPEGLTQPARWTARPGGAAAPAKPKSSDLP